MNLRGLSLNTCDACHLHLGENWLAKFPEQLAERMGNRSAQQPAGLSFHVLELSVSKGI